MCGSSCDTAYPSVHGSVSQACVCTSQVYGARDGSWNELGLTAQREKQSLYLARKPSPLCFCWVYWYHCRLSTKCMCSVCASVLSAAQMLERSILSPTSTAGLSPAVLCRVLHSMCHPVSAWAAALTLVGAPLWLQCGGDCYPIGLRRGASHPAPLLYVQPARSATTVTDCRYCTSGSRSWLSSSVDSDLVLSLPGAVHLCRVAVSTSRFHTSSSEICTVHRSRSQLRMGNVSRCGGGGGAPDLQNLDNVPGMSNTTQPTRANLESSFINVCVEGCTWNVCPGTCNCVCCCCCCCNR
uniref:Uncharacterized protein n=1 Tax=Lygus hesperus TaxID=30085 RepID=A0A146LZH4_LYGHE